MIRDSNLIAIFFGETERESWFESFFEMIQFKIDSRIHNSDSLWTDSR